MAQRKELPSSFTPWTKKISKESRCKGVAPKYWIPICFLFLHKVNVFSLIVSYNLAVGFRGVTSIRDVVALTT